MNQSVTRSIIRLLSVDQRAAIDRDSLDRLRSADWEAHLKWLDDSGLALHLLVRLRESGLYDVLPARVTSRLEHNLATNRRRLDVMAQEFKGLNRRFEEYGVKYAVLKGFALEPEFCPDAALRTWHDYDYLVDPGSVEAAGKALESRGFLKDSPRGSWADRPIQLVFSNRPLRLPVDRDEFYCGSLHRPVELHLALWDPHHNHVELNFPRDALLHRRIIRRRGAEFYALSNEDTLIYHAAHAFGHLLDCWCRPSWLLEIAHFLTLRIPDKEFWRRVEDRIGSSYKLQQAITLVFGLATHLFAGETPTFSQSSKPLSPALSFWIARYGLDWSLATFPGSKLSLFAYQEFVDDETVWRRIHRRRLWPIHRPSRVFADRGGGVWRCKRSEVVQWVHVVRRLAFHARSTLRYFVEAPRWRHCRRKFGSFESPAVLGRADATRSCYVHRS